MQLDKTRITIRERGVLEIYDLALRVLQGHGGSIFGYWLLGVAPFALFNFWLLRPYWSPPTGDDTFLQGEYYWALSLLMLWQFPFATAPLTLYLGKTLFLEHPTPGQVMRALGERAWQLFAVHGLFRGMFLFWPVLVFLAQGDEALAVLAGFWAALGVGIAYFLWPYFNEVLLLEANPLFRKKGRTSTLARVASLHGHASGEVFGRAMLALLFGVLLFGSLWLALAQLHNKAMLATESNQEVMAFYFQLSGWALSGFFTVVRFLSYLDLRIRIEGWEIELLLKAEGARIARQLA